MAVRNLPSESLIKAEGFWGYLYFSSVFGACVLKICVSPRSLGGGGFPSDAQDLDAWHDQDYLAAISLSLFFADTNCVLLFQAMLELAC